MVNEEFLLVWGAEIGSVSPKRNKFIKEGICPIGDPKEVSIHSWYVRQWGFTSHFAGARLLFANDVVV